MTAMFAEIGHDMGVLAGQQLHRRSLQGGLLFTFSKKRTHPLEMLVAEGARLLHFVGKHIPIGPRTVDPAAVIGFFGCFAIGVIIDNRPFFAHENQGDASNAAQHAIEQVKAAQGHGRQSLIPITQGLLQPGQRGRCPRYPHVASILIVLEGHARCKRPRKTSGIKAVKKVAMVVGIDPDPFCIIVGKCPANIVMAAQIISPHGSCGQVLTMTERLLQQPHIARGCTFPQQRHEGGIVGKLALLTADIAHHVIGMYNRLGFKHQARRGNLTQSVKRLNQDMGLRQIFARGPHLFPDEGHGIQP